MKHHQIQCDLEFFLINEKVFALAFHYKVNIQYIGQVNKDITPSAFRLAPCMLCCHYASHVATGLGFTQKVGLQNQSNISVFVKPKQEEVSQVT